MTLPPDLYGRRRLDRSWRVFAKALAGFEVVMGRFALEPVVRPVNDRKCALVVRRVVPQATDVVSLHLSAPDTSPLPTWQPGCHVDLELPSGTVRQYSLCGDPGDPFTYRIAVRRLGTGSQEVHRLAVGDEVRIRGPRNAFPFIRAPRYLFVAGGIGITPILPMVRLAAARGADWHLVYCGRSRDSMPFLDEIADLDADRVWIRPDTEFGVPVSGAELLTDAVPDTRVYCCGPPPMIASVRVDRASGLHYERFSPPPIRDGKPFTVELRRSGRTLDIPADRSALDVIRDAIPSVAYSCRQGFCGTCRVGLLGGDVQHHDSVLTDDERRHSMAICVSRSTGTLVLDL
ncbi:PDR/VanB family oxidoreductase [Actinocrispum wychmicini]|uniref:Ferredoxin-NADP reductase n=1 Tax=Actinocrispum wychmicini TaxID=1213861 RepID=A0A4R2J4J9_9PSEU|nr:PDR/VanB family oxidoreductase [Actinocrispum wychmicini]TCO53623.1 ferredoxin-NADP reductase [Actinocrispum wychmicini]